jgi:hypothetical protein
MEVRLVRVRASVFSALPIQGTAHNLAIENYVFDSLIASLGAFANLLD